MAGSNGSPVWALRDYIRSRLDNVLKQPSEARVASCWVTILTILLQPNQYLTTWSFYLFPKRTTSHSKKLKPLFSWHPSQFFTRSSHAPTPNKNFISHNYSNKYTSDSLFWGEFIQRQTIDFSDYHSFCSLWKISVLRRTHHLILISDLARWAQRFWRSKLGHSLHMSPVRKLLQ